MNPLNTIRAEDALSAVGELGWRSRDGMTVLDAIEMGDWIADNQATATEYAQQLAGLYEHESRDELARRLYVHLAVVRRARAHEAREPERFGRRVADTCSRQIARVRL